MKSTLTPLIALLGVTLIACGDDDSAADAAADATGTLSDGASLDASMGNPVFEYVPVEGALCANGTPVGMGVSPMEDASTLVVFVNGGGACWDGATCFALNSAVHISTTYNADVLAADLAPLQNSELIRRGGDSPIAGASFAFIPYCTGDLHRGNAVRDVPNDLVGGTREVHHVGRLNMEAFSRDLAVRFEGVERVVLVGFSAGGFGSIMNAHLFDDAFSQNVDVLADGSPFIQPTTYGAWIAQWDMELPEDCPDCASDFSAVLAAQMEGRRHGLITTTNDEVIRVFFGHGLNDISARTLGVVDAHYGASEQHAWVVAGTEHVLLGGYATRRRASGASLREWTDAFFEGGEAFSTLTP